MSNSLELLQGSIIHIQKKYKILSDIIWEADYKVDGSQSHSVNSNNLIITFNFSLSANCINQELDCICLMISLNS